MANSQTSLKKNILLNSIGYYGYIFCQWLLSILVVRLSGFNDAGIFSLAYSFTQIFLIIANFGGRGCQISDIHRRHTDGSYFATRTITCLFSLIVFGVALSFMNFPNYTLMCCIVMMSFKYMESATDVLFGTMQRYNRYDAIALSNVLKSIFPVIAFGVVIYYFSLFWAIAAVACICFLIIALYDIPAVVSNKQYTGAVFIKDIPAILAANLPLTLVNLVYPFMIFITRYVVRMNFSSEELGYYSSVTMLIMAMPTLTASMWTVLIPQLAMRYNEKQFAGLRRNIIKTFGVIIIFCFFLVILALTPLGKWGLMLVFGEEIASYTYLLPATLVISGIVAEISFVNAAMTAFQKRKDMLVSGILGAMVCLLATQPLVVKFGMIGSCYSLIMSMSAQTILLLAFLLKRLSIKGSTAA